MFDVREKPKMVERALLVSVFFGKESRQEAEELLTELGDLVDTLGIPIVDRMVVKSTRPHPRLLVGTGKADEIRAHAADHAADVIIFDNELSPAQQRKWEELTKKCVIDRQEVILDIFARRAHTREATLQVALARMEYSLPRLTRAWTHLSRQSGAGGTGGRGEGETQLETDRRIVRRRIDRLKADLEQVKKQRATRRKQRMRIPLPVAAIVGYTNAGKSSLLKALTQADVLVEDKLFATLDTTTRKLDLPNGQALLLTDTVGFVRRLPHDLVESFKATLEESLLADFLVHLLDASHPQVYELHETTMQVLKELGAEEKRILTVFNKIDKLSDRTPLIHLRRNFPGCTFISIQTGEGLPCLVHALADQLNEQVCHYRLELPADRADLLSLLHRSGRVLETEYLEGVVRVEAVAPNRLRAQLAAFELGAVAMACDPAPCTENAEHTET